MNKQILTSAISSIFDAESRETFLSNLPSTLRPRFVLKPCRHFVLSASVFGLDCTPAITLKKS